MLTLVVCLERRIIWPKSDRPYTDHPDFIQLQELNGIRKSMQEEYYIEMCFALVLLIALLPT